MERVKNLFQALIVIIVATIANVKDQLSQKIGEVNDSLSRRIDELSGNFNALKTYVDGKIPQVFSAIEAVKTSLQSSIDDIKVSINSVANDLSNYKTEVSTKLDTLKSELTSYIQTEVASLVQKIGEDDGRLQELVDNVTALAQADKGLVSTAGPQDFSDDQKTIARENIGAVSNMEFRNLNNDLNFFNTKTNERIDAIEQNSVDYEALKNELVDFLNSELASRGL